MVKIDLKDRRILYELDINSRQPNSEIAKKVGLSKQVVGLRIKKLVQVGIISSFHTVIDISKLGFAIHKGFLRLQNLDRGKEKEIIDFLVNHPNVVWVASCEGRFDLAFGTWAKDMAFLDKTLTDLNKRFGQHIAERQIATILRGEYFIREYLLGKKERHQKRESFFGAVPAPINVKSIDWNILLILGKNSRTTTVEIARTVRLSAETVAQRIRKLERSGVIRRYNIVPNESEYPYLHYKVLIGSRNMTEANEKTLQEYCRTHPNIVYIVKSLGPWDYEIDLETESAEQFRDVMRDIKTRFSDILKDYSSLHIYQVHKYNFCPSIQTSGITISQ